MSLVALEAGIAANQLFQLRNAYIDGSWVAIRANELLVTASEIKEPLKRIKQPKGRLSPKTPENEILEEAAEYSKNRKWIANQTLLPRGDQ